MVRYLARYVKRTAISPERILRADEHSVRFSYTDSQTGAPKQSEIGADEFMRRYLQHVPPSGLRWTRKTGQGVSLRTKNVETIPS